MIAETVCSAVAAAGLGIAAVTVYRKRFLAATRIAAYALVPLGLVMTGVVEWLADTAFSPTAWVGFGVLGLSWVLFATSRAVERRRRHSLAALGRPRWGRGPSRRSGPRAPRVPSPPTTSATSRRFSRSTASDRGVPERSDTVGRRPALNDHDSERTSRNTANTRSFRAC